jgi:hypothetical protein
MMKKRDKDSVPVSSLKIFEKEVGESKDELQKLSEKVDRSIEVNVELQAKIVDLMTKMTEMVETFREIARFMRATPRMEGIPSVEDLRREQEELMSASIEPAKIREPSGPRNVAGEIKELANQNRQLIETLKTLESELRKGSTKEAIRKALEKRHMA